MTLTGIRSLYIPAQAAEKTGVQIKIGDTRFQASFEDNKTTRALLKDSLLLIRCLS